MLIDIWDAHLDKLMEWDLAFLCFVKSFKHVLCMLLWVTHQFKVPGIVLISDEAFALSIHLIIKSLQLYDIILCVSFSLLQKSKLFTILTIVMTLILILELKGLELIGLLKDDILIFLWLINPSYFRLAIFHGSISSFDFCVNFYDKTILIFLFRLISISTHLNLRVYRVLKVQQTLRISHCLEPSCRSVRYSHVFLILV